MRNWIVWTVVVVLALVTAACAKLPQTEIDAATATMQQAEQAQAAVYAPDEWKKAQDEFAAAKAEIDLQGTKFALTRSYLKGKDLMLAASASAEAANAAAAAGRERAQAEAQASLDAVRIDVDEAAQLLAELAQCPRRPKGFAQDLELLNGSLEGLRGQLPEIEAAIGAEDFLGATSLAGSLSAQVETLSTDVESAKTKLGC